MEIIDLLKKLNGIDLSKPCLIAYNYNKNNYLGYLSYEVGENNMFHLYIEYKVISEIYTPSLKSIIRLLYIDNIDELDAFNKETKVLNFSKIIDYEENGNILEYIQYYDISNIEIYDILTPANFLSCFKFIGINNKETLSLIKSILTTDFSNLETVYDILYKFKLNLNLVKWALRLLKNNVIKNINELSNVLDLIYKYKFLTKKLKNKTVTAYNTVTDLYALNDEINYLIKCFLLKKQIDKFNTRQKKLLLKHSFSIEEANVFLKLNEIDSYIVKNIIKKVSDTYSVSKIIEIVNESCVSYYEWTYDSFVKYYSNKDVLELDCSIVYNNISKQTIILKVNNFVTMRRIANKTGWCISKYQDSWDTYSSEKVGNQYILFDFLDKNQYSKMIGFTLNKGNYFIKHAHLFDNGDCLDTPSFNCVLKDDESLVYKIFKEKGINLFNIFKPNTSVKFEWSIDGFIKFVNENNISKKCFIINKKNKCVLLKNVQIQYETSFEVFFQDKNTVDDFFHEKIFYGYKKYAIFDFTKSLSNKESIILFLSKTNNFHEEVIENEYYKDLSYCKINVLKFLIKNKLDEGCFELTNPFDEINYSILHLDEKNVTKLLKSYDFSKKVNPSYTSCYGQGIVFRAFYQCVLTFSYKTISLLFKKYNATLISLLYYNKYKPYEDEDEDYKSTLIDELSFLIENYLIKGTNDSYTEKVLFIIDEIIKYNELESTFSLCNKLLEFILMDKSLPYIKKIASIIYKNKFFDMPIFYSDYITKENDDNTDYKLNFIESLFEDKRVNTLQELINIENKHNIQLFRKDEKIIKFAERLSKVESYSNVLTNNETISNLRLICKKNQ